MTKVKLFALILFGLFTSAITGCGSTNNVHSDRLIQKRKYNKGFFLKNISFSKQSSATDKEVLYVDTEEKIEIDHKSSPKTLIAPIQDEEFEQQNYCRLTTQIDNVYLPQESNVVYNKDESPVSPGKPKWKRLRTGSFVALGTGVGFIAGSFIFSSWLYFAIILTFGIGLIALLISLILGLMTLAEKRKLPKVEKEKKEPTYPRWKIFGWIALGFLILGVALIIIGLAPMSGIASPAGALSILVAIILSIITLIKGISHKKNSPKRT